jgi:hypothetical protein
MSVMVMTVKMASPLPENFQAAKASTAMITMRGESAFKPASKPFRVCSTGHLRALKYIAVVVDQPVDKLGYPHIEWDHFVFKHDISPCSDRGPNIKTVISGSPCRIVSWRNTLPYFLRCGAGFAGNGSWTPPPCRHSGHPPPESASCWRPPAAGCPASSRSG